MILDFVYLAGIVVLAMVTVLMAIGCARLGARK
jgi:hypothetical protein